jgi:two-component system nitrate/nitrite response regulator NarL
VNANHPTIFASNDKHVLERWSTAFKENQWPVSCHSLHDLNKYVRQAPTNIILLDLHLPGLKGIDNTIKLITTHKKSLYLAMATFPNDKDALQLLEAGVRAYCNIQLAPVLLTHIVQLVEAGEVWLGADIMSKLINRIQPSESPRNTCLDSLTKRERSIAEHVAQGMVNKTIANKLGISERTVKAHLTAIFQKTGTRDRLQLALLVK